MDVDSGLTMVPQLEEGFGNEVESTDEGAVLGAEIALKEDSLSEVSGGDGETEAAVVAEASAPDHRLGCWLIWTGAYELAPCDPTAAAAPEPAPSSTSTK